MIREYKKLTSYYYYTMKRQVFILFVNKNKKVTWLNRLRPKKNEVVVRRQTIWLYGLLEGTWVNERKGIKCL